MVQAAVDRRAGLALGLPGEPEARVLRALQHRMAQRGGGQVQQAGGALLVGLDARDLVPLRPCHRLGVHQRQEAPPAVRILFCIAMTLLCSYMIRFVYTIIIIIPIECQGTIWRLYCTASGAVASESNANAPSREYEALRL